MRLTALLREWRRQAEDLRRRGGESFARCLESCAEDLEATLALVEGETVSLTDAARRSGYTSDGLGRLLREGKLRNHGTEARPRLRVADLPRKPGVAVGDPSPHLEETSGGRRLNGKDAA